MPRYLNANEGVSGKSGGGNRKGKSRGRNQSKEVNNNGRPKSAGVAEGRNADGASNFGDFSEVMSESGRLSVADSIDDDMVSVVAECKNRSLSYFLRHNFCLPLIVESCTKTSFLPAAVFGAGGEITEDQWAALEEKLKENIDNATHKK